MNAVTITKSNYEAEVAQSDKTVLLDFWASWCGPCREVAPILDEIARENDGIKVGKINVDEESELASTFEVMSIPLLVVVKNGKPVKQHAGSLPKAKIMELLADV
ncbi:MAG: thioredoxin [Defluviitaleaceae bacterium]|nr:thioredoxin [Defluviitaleaceae bacterium]